MSNELTHRWNFEQRDDGLYFCDGEHSKFEGCQFELVTEEVFRTTASRVRSEALEEAAGVAEGWPVKEWEDQYKDDIASAIRALASGSATEEEK